MTREPIANATAVVLARAGSKGLPGKNVREIAGKACIAWTIEQAMMAVSVGRVVVSSDDERALDIARRFGAVVHERSAEAASDSATVDAAAREALRAVDGDAPNEAHDGGPVALLYGNAPVRPDDLIDRAVALLRETGCDSVQSYCDVGKCHPWWQVRVDDDGRVAPWEGEELFGGVYRRQDLPPAFVPDGGVIALTRAALFGQIDGATPGPHAFLGVDRRGVTTKPGEVVDIDTPIDLRVAEAVLSSRCEDARRVG
ncbi:MAG: acylneuraminate cytidylyltransferase family protein [Planctomycetota bacterium]